MFLFVALVTGSMLASGLTEIYFSYQENKVGLVRIQQEKALAASHIIEAPINASNTDPINQTRICCQDYFLRRNCNRCPD